MAPCARLSIVIPVLNEAATIEASLRALGNWRIAGAELIVVDGGSDDDTVALARPLCDKLIMSRVGRARQMNAGAASANRAEILFLHADTRLPEPACWIGLEAGEWGFFSVRLQPSTPALRMVSCMMNLRSRLTRVGTGDQCLFVARNLFERLGGFADIELMEDVALCKMLRRESRPRCMSEAVISSSRRWLQHGVLRTIVLMWQLRLLYFLGADPARLAHRYRHAR